MNGKSQGLISVFVGIEGHIQKINLINCFVSGEQGRFYEETMHEICDVRELESHNFFEKATILDSLYHVYISLHMYGSGEDFEVELIINNIVHVTDNYTQILKEEEDFAEQRRLLDNDESSLTYVELKETWGSYYRYDTNITPNDVENFIKIISQYDLRLAHKFMNNKEGLRKLLGDLYDENVHNVEIARNKFKNFIKYSSSLKKSMAVGGYNIDKYALDFYNKDSFFISFEDINNISDAILLEFNHREVLRYFYDTKVIIKAFELEDIKNE